MTEATVSFAGNLTDDPELRHTEGGIARAIFRVAVSARRDQEASFFTVIVWRDQAEHAAQSLAKGSRVVVVGRLQQRSLDRRGRQRPIGRGGRGRGAGSEPAVGDGDDDQGDTEPGPVTTIDQRCDERDADRAACQRPAPSLLEGQHGCAAETRTYVLSRG